MKGSGIRERYVAVDSSAAELGGWEDWGYFNFNEIHSSLYDMRLGMKDFSVYDLQTGKHYPEGQMTITHEDWSFMRESAFAIRQALSYMGKKPEKNLPKLLDWFDRFDQKNTLKTQRDAIRQVAMDKDNNWHQLVISLWTDIDPGVRNRLFENLIINGCLLGYQRQKENKAKYNCNVPWAILLDPTSACNLKCTGCWVAEYGNQMNLSYEEMGYHDNQPWNDNMLRPCPVLDNPGRLTELVEKSQAKSTDYQNLETAKEFSDKCVEAAEKWAPVADRLWVKSHSSCASCGRCKRAVNE